MTVRIWWQKYRESGRDETRIKNAQELQEKYGAVVAELAKQHPTTFKLCKALRGRDPRVYVSDGVAN